MKRGRVISYFSNKTIPEFFTDPEVVTWLERNGGGNFPSNELFEEAIENQEEYNQSLVDAQREEGDPNLKPFNFTIIGAGDNLDITSSIIRGWATDGKVYDREITTIRNITNSTTDIIESYISEDGVSSSSSPAGWRAGEIPHGASLTISISTTDPSLYETAPVGGRPSPSEKLGILPANARYTKIFGFSTVTSGQVLFHYKTKKTNTYQIFPLPVSTTPVPIVMPELSIGDYFTELHFIRNGVTAGSVIASVQGYAI